MCRCWDIAAISVPRAWQVALPQAQPRRNVETGSLRVLEDLMAFLARSALLALDCNLQPFVRVDCGSQSFDEADFFIFQGKIGFAGFCRWARSMLKRLQHLTGAKTSASYPQMAGIACISAFFFFAYRFRFRFLRLYPKRVHVLRPTDPTVSTFQLLAPALFPCKNPRIILHSS
jgi:hypothetical protein